MYHIKKNTRRFDAAMFIGNNIKMPSNRFFFGCFCFFLWALSDGDDERACAPLESEQK